MTPHCLSITDAAKALGISKSSAYKIISEGQLRSIRIGGRHVVPVASVEAFIASSLHATAPNQDQTAAP